MLSGEGSDEIFGGYPIYHKMQILDHMHKVIPFKKVLLKMFSSPKNNDKSLKYLDWLMLPLEKRYFGVSCDTTSSIKQKLYSDSFKSLSQKNGVERIFQKYYNNVKDRDVLGKMLYIDTKTWSLTIC